MTVDLVPSRVVTVLLTNEHEVPVMSHSSGFGERMTRRQAVCALSAAGASVGLLGGRLHAAAPQESGKGIELLLGLNSWSYALATGIRPQMVKPRKPLTAAGILEKVCRWGLKGAQIQLNQMPKLGSDEFQSLRKTALQHGLFLEVCSGRVQDEKGMLEALEYNVALGSQVVRTYMELFKIQFEDISLDDYVSDAIRHIGNLLPQFEKRRVHICLENHGGLRTKYLHRVLKTFPSEYLAVNLDTGDSLLTLEDPVEVAREFAPRTYTCHLKDWKLLRNDEGIVVRGCAVGDGAVDTKAIVQVLRTRAPQGRPLHVNIQATQEYLPLKLFTAEYWRKHGDVTGSELEHILRLAEKQNVRARKEDLLPSDRGEPESVILAEEEIAVARSVAYCRDVLRLL